MKAPEELGSEPDTEMPPPSSAGGVDTVCQVLKIRCDGVQCLRSGPQLGAEGQLFPVLTWLETLGVCVGAAGQQAVIRETPDWHPGLAPAEASGRHSGPRKASASFLNFSLTSLFALLDKSQYVWLRGTEGKDGTL